MRKARLAAMIAICISALGLSQVPSSSTPQSERDVFSTSSCMGCHGQSAMGGLGGPIAQTKLSIEAFRKIVREGKGMMPATPASELNDDDVAAIHSQLRNMPYLEDQIPIAFKVGRNLKTQSTFYLFTAVFSIAAVCAIWNLRKWIRCSALKDLFPFAIKFGLGKSVWVLLKSLVVDGLLVGSLWKASKQRWIMHGMMLYGFIGLIVADVLMTIYNPSRGDLALTAPLKLLPIVSGSLLMFGVFFVMFRYKRDPYIDNGLTLGADFLFVNLLFHTVVSGFLTVLTNRYSLFQWVMPIYIYHLGAIILLILTAPFSRFQHAWVVPIMAALTRLTEAVSASGVDLGFQREPSPGRHHKSNRIAENVLQSLGNGYADEEFKLRYYP